MKKYNLAKKESYIKDGKEVSYWVGVGTMIEFDQGGRIVEIPAIGLKANVFEQKQKTTTKKPPTIDNEEINSPEDLPF